MDVERVRGLQQRAALPLLGYLRHKGAERIRLYWSEIGSAATGRLHLEYGGGSSQQGDVPLDAMDALSVLRAEMVEPGKGAWLSTLVEVDTNAKYSLRFNYEHRPFWNAESSRMEPPPSGVVPIPGDAAFVADLERYPRADELVPGWYPRSISSSESELLATESLTVPVLIDAYASLTSSESWTQLAELLSEGMAGALRELHEPRDLHDEFYLSRFFGRAAQRPIEALLRMDEGQRLDAVQTAVQAGLLDGAPMSADREEQVESLGDLIGALGEARTAVIVEQFVP